MFLQSRIPKHIIYLAENGPLLAGFFTGPLDIKPKDEKHMRVAAIVTHDPSDLYFANQLAKRYKRIWRIDGKLWLRGLQRTGK